MSKFSLVVLCIAAVGIMQCSCSAPAYPAGKPLATFDGSKETEWDWHLTNDPVMGGISRSTFNVSNKIMSWEGEVLIVPKLQAPGFCELQTQGFGSHHDVSGTTHALLQVRTSSPEYLGFKMSFSANTLNPQFKSFKSNFNVTVGNDWTVVAIPWTSFSKDWSPFTGDCDTKDPTGTQHYCCSSEHPEVCPTDKDLEKIQALGLWTEGHSGNFTLEVNYIGGGSNATADMSVRPKPVSLRRPAKSQVVSTPAFPTGTPLATWDGNKDTTWDWHVTNDPVMGGISVSTFNISGNTMNWQGEVKIVPSLQAPGFCSLKTEGEGSLHDVSDTTHALLQVKTSSPEYLGFKMSFAGTGIVSRFKSFKSNFNVTVGNEWTVVAIPWSTFSNDWSPFTGDCDTKDPDGKQHHCCSSEHPEVCATKRDLSQLKSLELTAEGHSGNFDLEVNYIGAGSNATADITVPSPVIKPTLRTASLRLAPKRISAPAYPDGKPLATWDGAKETEWNWRVTNDPVMGGVSRSTFNISDNTMNWEGEVLIVPSLKAPGFCNLETQGFGSHHDMSGTTHALLQVRTSSPEYLGFKMSFAANTLNPQFKSFKSNFNVTVGNDWTVVAIPWTSFSNDWSPYTGDCDTKDPTGKQHYCCSSEHPEVCPTDKDLEKIQALGLWTEGHSGNFTLEVNYIGGGSNATADVSVGKATPKTVTGERTCKGLISPELRFNVSHRLAKDYLPYNFGPLESLVEAICCDQDYESFAEPQDFFARPDVNLFGNLSSTEPTTFYDPVCGIPLFRAPVNRTLADFKQDTTEHSWPSFRGGEAIKENLNILSDGKVMSTCGTHLGDYMPDADGNPRYCIDLVCISGNPKK